LLPSPLGAHLGELLQTIIHEGAEYGVSVEVDTSDRTRPGEMRGGASPIGAIEVAVVAAAAGYGARQLARLGDKVFDAALEWLLRHREKDPPPGDPVAVTLYGPDGKPLKKLLVPQGEGDKPPYEPRGTGRE
jgi:hypothetical protein